MVAHKSNRAVESCSIGPGGDCAHPSISTACSTAAVDRQKVAHTWKWRLTAFEFISHSLRAELTTTSNLYPSLLVSPGEVVCLFIIYTHTPTKNVGRVSFDIYGEIRVSITSKVLQSCSTLPPNQYQLVAVSRRIPGRQFTVIRLGVWKGRLPHRA